MRLFLSHGSRPLGAREGWEFLNENKASWFIVGPVDRPDEKIDPANNLTEHGRTVVSVYIEEDEVLAEEYLEL